MAKRKEKKSGIIIFGFCFQVKMQSAGSKNIPD